MKQLLSIAALSCALPLHSLAQDAAPADPPCRAGPGANAPGANEAQVSEHQPNERASAALPARVGTRPMPERGSIAPAGRVPSHVESASSRAMAAANARQEAGEAKKVPLPPCAPAASDARPADIARKD